MLGTRAQQLEQLILGGGQRDTGAERRVDRHGVGRVDPITHVAPASLSRVPACECAQSGQQLLELERFDQVVVGAAVQTGDPVLEGAERGEHQDRGGDPGTAHGRDQLQAAHCRQPPVHNHHVKMAVQTLLQALLGVGYMINRVELGQDFDEHLGNIRIILNE
ncbi:hypothetical protein SDC9_131355 [bioreactor metagenome]|uniref:Uncharacterized protein n=1 Tax=bioreactor metagenome TaxID=1076179 RepID=A0A645D4N9_9ZZZZ